MSEFFNKNNNEILQTLDRRHKLDIAKITFTMSFLGLGSLRIDQNYPLLSALFLAPLVALSFDLFIMRELHSLRRIGNFIATNTKYKSTIDREFEKAISENRNRYHRIGFMLLTVIVWLAAFLLYLYSKNYNIYTLDDSVSRWIFLVILTIIFIVHLWFIIETVIRFDRSNDIWDIIIPLIIFVVFFVLTLVISLFLFAYLRSERIIFSHQNNVAQIINSVNVKDNNSNYQLNVALINKMTEKALKELEDLDKPDEKRNIILFLSDIKLLPAMNLNHADLNDANLSGINFTNKEGYGTDLKGANLKKVKLRGSVLEVTNLGGANLEEADLEKAYVKNADLRGANLQQAYLEEATNLAPKQIKSACFWEQAIYKGEWDEEKEIYVAIEPDNTNYIKDLKKDKSSDPKETVDCSRWEK